MTLISCNDVTLAYENNIVLKNLSFEVQEGDYLCVVGENGSGKSTLIKALLSLKTCKNGCIDFDKYLKKNEIGYLPQQSEAQKDFPASVWEVVLSGCLNQKGLRPFYNSIEKDTALLNINKLGMNSYLNFSYSELSNGQQQRVLLARALCSTKKLLLLDEPAAGLDPVIVNDFYTLINNLNQEGITVVMVSHDITSAVKYASHILHLNNDNIFFGSTGNYLSSELGISFLGGKSYV